MDIGENKIKEVMQSVIDSYLIPKFNELGMNASGDWINALEARANGNIGEIWGLDYTRYLVNGRASGTPPPVQPLVRWVGFKLGLSGTEALGAAFAIRNKIAQEGTEIYKQGGTDLLEILQSKEVLDFVNNQIKDIIVKEISLKIIRQTKEAFANG